MDTVDYFTRVMKSVISKSLPKGMARKQTFNPFPNMKLDTTFDFDFLKYEKGFQCWMICFSKFFF